MLELPDILVCGVGGTLGEAWMRGLLDGASAESGLDFRRCEHFVGSSAGSIVCATLAAGRRPDAGAGAAAAWAEAAGDPPDDEAADEAPDVAEAAGEATLGATARLDRLTRGAARLAARTGAAALTPVAPLALAAAAPGGAMVRAAALRAIPRGGHSLERVGEIVEGFAPRFDGRLRIVTVDRATGRRVVFGAPGAPRASVRDAVLASCAVPGIFPPVRIGGREYVDGGVWSPTNLDVAPAQRRSRVLCLVPTAASREYSALTAAVLATETMALRARGAELTVLRPDPGSTEAIGGSLMNRRRRAQVLAAGYAQGRRAAAGDR